MIFPRIEQEYGKLLAGQHDQNLVWNNILIIKTLQNMKGLSNEVLF